MLDIETKTRAIVDALEDIKADDIAVIDTSKLSPLFERMIIASAKSSRQTKAIANNVVVKLKALGEEVLGREGEGSGEGGGERGAPDLASRRSRSRRPARP